jgi:exodeoxyribonuclease VII small subunit
MPDRKKSFAELNDALETIIDQLQVDDIDVDEALKLYERGIKLTEQLETQLKQAENTIRELKFGQ